MQPAVGVGKKALKGENRGPRSNLGFSQNPREVEWGVDKSPESSDPRTRKLPLHDSATTALIHLSKCWQPSWSL